MIALAALLLAVQPSHVVVTPARAARPAAPMLPPNMVRTVLVSSDGKSLTTLGVRISSDGRVLLVDRLRVAGNSGNARLQTERSEAPLQPCTSDNYRSDDNTTVEFSVYRQNENGFRVTFNWRRPADASCRAGRVGVSLEQTVDLAPGQSVTLSADAGVRIELSRD